MSQQLLILCIYKWSNAVVNSPHLSYCRSPSPPVGRFCLFSVFECNWWLGKATAINVTKIRMNQDPLKIEIKCIQQEKESKSARFFPSREKESGGLATYHLVVWGFEIRREIRLGQWVIDHSTGLSYVPPNENGHLSTSTNPSSLTKSNLWAIFATQC